MPHYSQQIQSIVVTCEELTKCGISEGYLNRAFVGQRKGEVYCWEHTKIGNKIFVHYNSLKEKYKTLIKNIFCNGIEPEVWIKSQENDKAQAQLDQLTDSITQLVVSKTEELTFLMETQLYTPIECHQLARAAAWLRLIIDFDVKRARQIGFASVVDFRNEVFKRCLNEQNSKTPLIRFKKGNINNLRVLVRNADEYKRIGIKSLVHAGAGNVNREKADTLCHAKLIELQSNPVKYSYEDVALMFNDWADSNKKQNLTVSAIKQYLNTPKIKKVWFYSRHGKLAADNEIQQIQNRDLPSFPDALWSIDGSTVQLYYRDENGKMLSDLYAYFVSDSCTSAILGASVAFAETANMVSEALIEAVNTYENKPYQIQYDNSSANQSAIAQSLMSNMSRVHFGCEPYKGRSKYIESIIGHFQQRVLRKRTNFKGGNITTKSLNSKANNELLAFYKKHPEELPSLDEALIEFKEAISEWNNRGEKRDSFGRFVGSSKISKYNSIQHELRSKLNYFDRISLFMVEFNGEYPYTTEGIRVEINGTKHKFRVPDPDNIGDFMFANENLGKKFKIRINRQHPEICSLFLNGKFIDNAYEMEKAPSCVADMKDGDKGKQIVFKAKQEQFGVEYSKSVLEQQKEILGELQATGTDGIGWWDTHKIKENSKQNKLEDVRNGVADGYTETEKKLMKIGN